MQTNSADLEFKSKIEQHLEDQAWRLNNLYYIKDTHGKKIRFEMNWAQIHFYNNMHFFNIILKARQLGFSTFILIWKLDACLFNSNHSCGVIAQGLVEAEDLFDNKVKFAYDNLPQWLRDEVTATTDNARKLEFSNGSQIYVGTSLRGGTLQKLHVSEYGKISAKFPPKAKEIKTGAMNTIHAGQIINVESTAEGQSGEFFDLVKLARRLEDEKKELSPLDPKFHFYPWWQNPSYTMFDSDTDNTTFTIEDEKYFETLRKECGIELTRNQQAWYVKKKEIQGDDMLSEYPSTPDEAFAASIKGAYYGKQMTSLRKRGMITKVPWEPGQLVHTFWDLGNFNYTSIWFFQNVGREYRMIRFYQNSGDDLRDYVKYLRETEYDFGTHYLPHDGNQVRLSLENKSVKATLESLGLRNIKIVPVSKNVQFDIETKCKPELMKCWIDAVNCADGIKCLDNYKREWDDTRAVWKDKPKHDEFSDGADAFRTFASGYQPEKKSADINFQLPAATNNSFMSG